MLIYLAVHRAKWTMMPQFYFYTFHIFYEIMIYLLFTGLGSSRHIQSVPKRCIHIIIRNINLVYTSFLGHSVFPPS
jgi:hypothetical protein